MWNSVNFPKGFAYHAAPTGVPGVRRVLLCGQAMLHSKASLGSALFCLQLWGQTTQAQLTLSSSDGTCKVWTSSSNVSTWYVTSKGRQVPEHSYGTATSQVSPEDRVLQESQPGFRQGHPNRRTWPLACVVQGTRSEHCWKRSKGWSLTHLSSPRVPQCPRLLHERVHPVCSPGPQAAPASLAQGQEERFPCWSGGLAGKSHGSHR